MYNKFTKDRDATRAKRVVRVNKGTSTARVDEPFKVPLAVHSQRSTAERTLNLEKRGIDCERERERKRERIEAEGQSRPS